MGILYLLLSIIAESTGKTIDKLNFKKNRIAPRQMMLLIFAAMTVILLAFVFATHQTFPNLTLISAGLVTAVVLASFGSNVFDVLSLKADDLSLREPLCDFQPIVAGLIGYTLFPGERKPGFLLAFLLGAFIVYWGTHRRKLRRLQKRGMTYLLLAVCLEALLPSIFKFALEYLSPAYLALFRVIGVLVLTVLFFPPKRIPGLTSGRMSYSLLAGLVYAVGAVASIAAINSLGVVLTMLLLLFGPFLRYMSGYFILKENVRRGEIVSSFLLALVVVIPIIK